MYKYGHRTRGHPRIKHLTCFILMFAILICMLPLNDKVTATEPQTCRLDINGYLDETVSYTLGNYATADLYINDNLVESGVNDFNYSAPVGSTYRIEIHPNSGYSLAYKNIWAPHEGVKMYTAGVDTLEGTVDRTTTIPFYPYIYTLRNLRATYDLPDGVTGNIYVDNMNMTGLSSVFSKAYFKGRTINELTDDVETTADYSFAGYWSEKTGGRQYKNGDEFDVLTNLTLYARWIPNKFTLNYNYNVPSGASSTLTGADVKNKSISYSGEGTNVYGTLPTPCCTGYTFDGWYTEAAGGEKVDAATTYMDVNEKTIYAHWTALNNTINYNVETVYPSWAGDKSHIGGTVNITSEVVSGNNAPIGATATAADGFVFDGWYSSTGELITKDATIKPLNCNAEDRGRFTNPLNGGSSIYNASTDTYIITTNTNPETWKNWGSGVHHISQEIPWNNWYIAEFEVWSPIDAECVIDINNLGPNGHSWNGNDNDNYDTRFYNQNGTDSIFSLKANTWKKIIIWYQNSNSKNTNHESLWDQHTIAFRYNESLGSQTSKVRNYKAAVSPTLIKELDTFTARFKPWEHTVAYDANGGTGTPESFQKCTWTSRWISSTIPTRTGYTFKSWNTKKDGTGTTFNPGQQYIPDINGGTATLYAQWTPKTYVCYIYGNGGTLETIDPPIDEDGHAYFGATYGAPYFYILGVVGKKTGYHMTGVYDHINGGIKVWNAPDVNDKIYHGTACYSVRGTKYYDDNNIWHYDNGAIFYVQYAPNNYIITFNYNKPSTFDDNMQTKTVTYDSNIGQLPLPSYTGWTFKSWNTKADGTGTTVTENTVYKIAGDSTLYAQWSYNPVSVKVPRMLIGDHTGKSQFRVKCDDFKAGSIKVTVPSSFPYKQTGKADVTAAITAKSGNNTITPANKVCVYDITTKNGLSAGCWQGSFNIGLTLTKE